MKVNQLKEATDLLWEVKKLEIFRRYVSEHPQGALLLTMEDRIPCFVLTQSMSTDILNIIEKDVNRKLDELGIEREE